MLFLDNDKRDFKDDRSITRAISDIEKSGKKVFCIQPELINESKTDYNDLLKSDQISKIRSDIDQAFNNISEKNKVEISENDKRTASQSEKTYDFLIEEK